MKVRRFSCLFPRAIVALGLILGLAPLAACSDPPRVLQGTVALHDAHKGLLTVRDERPPRGEVTFSLAHADIGATPKPGDLVRIAFRVRDGVNQAGRVMNITRQAELHAPGGH